MIMNLQIWNLASNNCFVARWALVRLKSEVKTTHTHTYTHTRFKSSRTKKYEVDSWASIDPVFLKKNSGRLSHPGAWKHEWLWKVKKDRCRKKSEGISFTIVWHRLSEFLCPLYCYYFFTINSNPSRKKKKCRRPKPINLSLGVRPFGFCRRK